MYHGSNINNIAGNIIGVDKTRNVKLFLDCCSQKSYILKSLAVELGLLIVSKESIVHTLFGDAKNDSQVLK